MQLTLGRLGCLVSHQARRASQLRQLRSTCVVGSRPVSSSSNKADRDLLPEGVRALVLDCDGTIIDSMPNHYKAWQAACTQFGLSLSVRDFLAMAGKPTSEILSHVCRTNSKAVDREAFMAVKYRWYESEHEMPLIQPVMEIMQAARARGLPMAVASGGSRDHVVKNLGEVGIYNWFSAVVCAEDVEHGKPAPDGFLLAAKRLGVDPAYCAGYEDSLLGMEALRLAGYGWAINVTLLPGYPLMQDGQGGCVAPGSVGIFDSGAEDASSGEEEPMAVAAGGGACGGRQL